MWRGAPPRARGPPMDYADKLPPRPWYIFTPPQRYNLAPPLTRGLGIPGKRAREGSVAGLDAARARGRKGGRPPKLGPKEIEAARAMLSGSGLTTAEICGQLGVGRSTLYRHLHASGWEREAPGRPSPSP